MNGFKSLRLAIVAILSVTAVESAQARELYKGTDISPALTYFSKYVHTLTYPVFVYNWSQSVGAGWAKIKSAQDPIGPRIISQGATGFWTNFGQADGGNMYGYGLYAALDPLTTDSFGGDAQDDGYGNGGRWILIQMRLPAGFRFINLVRDQMVLPDDVANVLVQFQCETESGAMFDPFQPSYGSDPNCIGLIKKIFGEALRIDGFLYAYESTPYSTCQKPLTSADRQGAFVIVSNRWVTPQNIEVFDPVTSDALPDRLRIQTLMDESTITGQTANAFSSDDYGASVRWADLQTQRPDPTIFNWMKANLLGCEDTLPYTDNVPK